VLVTLVGSGVAGPQTALAAQHAPSTASVADDWPTYLHDLTRSGASADATLSTANVAQLAPLWSYHTGGVIAASPTVVGGIAYVGSWDGYEYAFDASTGALRWRTYLGITIGGSGCYPQQLGISSVATVQGGVVYVGGGDAYWYALDANTGAVLWRVFTGDNSATGGHYNWSSPLIYNGFAYVGVASVGDCPLVQGQLLKVDLSAHQVIATLNVVPNGQLGGGIWTSPALDTTTGTIYVTTGTLADPSQTYSQALLAVDANTLAITSAWQVPQNQVVVDSDWGTTPVLFSDTSGRQLVAAINKNGYVYAFLRSNVAAGPIWRQLIALGGACPTCGDGSVSSMVFANGRLYVAGGNTTVNGVGYPGAVRALDSATGAIVWEHGDPSPVLPALAYADGLVIAGTGNALEVLDASSGARLYSFPTETQAALFGPPSIAHGTLFFGSADGTVYALALPSAPPTSPPPDANCPAGWICQDIGAPAPSGSETTSGATWTISAGGAGMTGTDDQMRLLAQSITGDTQITAQVAAPQSSSASAQTGLMLRQSADPTSPYYAVVVGANNTLAVFSRTSFGATASLLNTVTLSASLPYLEIQRTGDVFQAATSSDGSVYTLVPGSTLTLVMPTSVLMGVAATSGASGTPATTTVSGVQIAAPSTPPLPVPPASACPAGWSCADVGNPLIVGNQTLSSSTWTLTAGGADIVGYNDQFHYVWQTLPADGTLSAAVSTQSNTSPWARVGLMFRQSASPGAAYYAAFITPGNGIVIQYRAVTGLTTTTLSSVAGTVPLFLKISRFGNAFTAYESADGATWAYIARSTAIFPLGSSILAGLAMSSHNATTAGATTLSAVTLTNTGAPPPAGCPSGWTCGDIGSPALVGSESYASGNWYIQAGGNDIWNTSDEFHFDWQTIAGDGTLSAHLSQQSDSDPWAKAGLMLRLSSDPSAPFYDVVMTPGNGIAVQYRATAGASAAEAADVSVSAPLFLRIGRSGTTFAAYTSTDGVTWTLVPNSSVAIPALSGALLAGMAATSHNVSKLGQAAFDSVTFDTCAAGWTCQDIGNPLPAGTHTSNAGMWTVSSGGSDIWGTADQFHYVWQSLPADGSLTVRVTSQTNTSSWAKAGVMLRLTTDPGAPFYDVVATPSNGVSIQYRAAASTSAQLAANVASLIPVYLRVARTETTFAAYTSTDGVTWTLVPNSSVAIPALSGALLAGMAVTAHNNGVLSTATFDSVALSTCPTGWSCADIGGPAPAGSASAIGAAWTGSGGGSDIWGTADQFQFDAQPLAGDGTISAQVTSQTNTNGWAKAGVMARTSADPAAAFYDVVMTPANGVAVQFRPTTGGPAQYLASLSGAPPLYLRIARNGTTFSAYTSADGMTWTLVPNSSVAIPALAGTLLAGLAVSSHNNGTLSTATFAGVSLIPCPAGWSCADIGAPALAGTQSLSGSVWTIAGGGSDIWGSGDHFHYVWRSLAGDGTLSEHVTSQTNTSTWAKAGLMLRLSTDPSAPFYDVVMTPANGVAVQYRATAGGLAQQVVDLSGLTVPMYLRITRSATTYSASTSPDGVTWTTVVGSTVSISALSGTLLAGLAVTSHNSGALSTATFDTVTMPATAAMARMSAATPSGGKRSGRPAPASDTSLPASALDVLPACNDWIVV
jgi:outer membrane protein assembly factor BamB